MRWTRSVRYSWSFNQSSGGLRCGQAFSPALYLGGLERSLILTIPRLPATLHCANGSPDCSLSENQDPFWPSTAAKSRTYIPFDKPFISILPCQLIYIVLSKTTAAPGGILHTGVANSLPSCVLPLSPMLPGYLPTHSQVTWTTKSGMRRGWCRL